MAWIVDTCVLLDIRLADPVFAESSAQCLRFYSREGLGITPVTYVELAPQFYGDLAEQDAFLSAHRIQSTESWEKQDTLTAASHWALFVARKRAQKLPRRPVADVLIAAFAARFQGLITRNADDFRKVAPTLRLVDASTFSPGS